MTLPLIVPDSVSLTRCTAFATPKSTSFTPPEVVRKMFCGDTSRWTRPSERSFLSRLSWTYCRPAQIPMALAIAISSGSFFPARASDCTMRRVSRPCRYSMAR